jgi:hypothetical protein
MDPSLGSNEEREAIYKILQRVLEKWREQLGTKEEELEKTVVLSPRVSPQEKETPSSVKEVFKEKRIEEEILPETVIIAPKEKKERISIKYEMPKLEENELKPSEEEPPQSEEFLEETVILKPKRIREPKGHE